MRHDGPDRPDSVGRARRVHEPVSPRRARRGRPRARRAFRALQGFLGGSMIQPSSRRPSPSFPARRSSSPRQRSVLCRHWLSTLGPTVGGWITDNYSWHGCFSSTSSPACSSPLLFLILVRIDRPNLSLLKGADYLGMVLMAVFLGCLEHTLEEGPRWTGSVTTPSGRPPGSLRSVASLSSGAAWRTPIPWSICGL